MAETRAFHSVAVQALDDGNIMVTIDDDLGKRNVHVGLVAGFRLALSMLRACEEVTERKLERLAELERIAEQVTPE